MARGFRITKRDQAFHLAGAFDEAADFAALGGESAQPLRLNLAGIQTINSLGLRRLIAFVKGLGARDVEFAECPPVFVEAVNVTPTAVGGTHYIGRIKSVLIPYHCPGDHEHAFVVPTAAVRTDEEIVLPAQTCPRCQKPMTADLETDADEFFFFLSTA